MRGRRPAFIKSDKALQYLKNFSLQARRRDPLFTEDVVLAVRVWYASRRPDLDITLIKDLLQGVAYENDRQVKMEHAVWDLDPSAPRCHIVVAPLDDWENVVAHIHEKSYASDFRPN